MKKSIVILITFLLSTYISNGQSTTSSNTLSGTLPSSPTQYLGSSNAADVIFKTNNVERMRILSSGLNVGIGTSSPTGILQIHNPSALSSYIHFTNYSVGQTASDGAYIGQYNYTTMFQLMEANADYTCFEFKNTNGDLLFRINSLGSVGIGTFNHSSKFQINGNAAIGYSSAVNAPTNGLCVGGNVGIGTISPSAKLEIVGKLKIVDSTQGLNKVLTSDANGLSSWSTISSLGGITSTCSTVNLVPKMTGNNVIGCSQIFDNGNNVGIGTTNPTKKLVVAGSTYVQDSLFIGQSLKIDSLAGEGFKIDSLSNKSLKLVFADENGNLTSDLKKILPEGGEYCIPHTYPWFLGGNTMPTFATQGVEPADWIGTCSSYPFIMRTNGIERMRITPNGNVGIGTTNPDKLLHVNGNSVFMGDVSINTLDMPTGYKLAVNGKIICEELMVKLHADWPDYVFNKDYKLMSLKDLEDYINKNNHLPNVPSASVVKNGGVNVGESNAILLQKIEELTLYVIQLSKKNEELQKEMEFLKNSK